MSDCDKDHCRYDHDAVTKAWEALGSPAYDGRHVSEHVAEVVAHVAAMQAELDAAKDEVERADAKIVERAAELSSSVVIEGAVEAFRQRAVAAVQARRFNAHQQGNSTYEYDRIIELLQQLSTFTEDGE